MIYTRLFPNLQRKTLGPLMALALLVGLSSGLPGGSVMAAGAGDIAAPDAMEMPDVTQGLVDATDKAFQIGDLKGGPVLVNFWATWCAPCVAELPALSRAAEALVEDGVTVLLVSIDRGGAEKAMPFLEKYGVSGVSLGFDPRARLSREMGVQGLPTTFLLNDGQSQVWPFVGPFEWDDPAMLAIIRERVGRGR